MAIIKTTCNPWDGMPEFAHQDLTSYRKVIVHFASEEDVAKFSELIGQDIGKKIKSVWFPKAAIGRYRDLEYS